MQTSPSLTSSFRLDPCPALLASTNYFPLPSSGGADGHPTGIQRKQSKGIK